MAKPSLCFKKKVMTESETWTYLDIEKMRALHGHPDIVALPFKQSFDAMRKPLKEEFR